MLRYYNIHFSVFCHSIICSILFSFYSLLLSLFILPREFQLAAGHWTPTQGGFDDEDERFLSCPVTRFIHHHITRTLWFLFFFTSNLAAIDAVLLYIYTCTRVPYFLTLYPSSAVGHPRPVHLPYPWFNPEPPPPGEPLYARRCGCYLCYVTVGGSLTQSTEKNTRFVLYIIRALSQIWQRGHALIIFTR